jgi:hypothetical protein
MAATLYIYCPWTHKLVNPHPVPFSTSASYCPSHGTSLPFLLQYSPLSHSLLSPFTLISLHLLINFSSISLHFSPLFSSLLFPFSFTSLHFFLHFSSLSPSLLSTFSFASLPYVLTSFHFLLHFSPLSTSLLTPFILHFSSSFSFTSLPLSS